METKSTLIVNIKGINEALKKKDYPFYNTNSSVTLVYKGAAKKVKFLSDITGWTDPVSFGKIKDTDLFILQLNIEPDARIQYLLVVDGEAILDPSNKFQSLHGLGAMSEISMPEYKRHPYFDEFLCGEEGNFNGLIKHILPASVLPYEHEIYIYLPPDYNLAESYPVIYFHDGPDYIRFGLAPYSINRLIIEKKIKPCIAVFVSPPNLHQPLEPNRSTEYGLNEDYVKFFCNELVPFVDANYKTIKMPQNRLIIGDSYAGLISVYIAFSHPEVFSNVYSQSGYFSFRKNRLINLIKEQTNKQIKIFFDIGTYEEKVGSDFLPSDELNFIKANREMKEVLTLNNYSYEYREYHEGHTWGNWRRHLLDALIYFLGAKGEQL